MCICVLFDLGWLVKDNKWANVVPNRRARFFMATILCVYVLVPGLVVPHGNVARFIRQYFNDNSAYFKERLEVKQGRSNCLNLEIAHLTINLLYMPSSKYCETCKISRCSTYKLP